MEWVETTGRTIEEAKDAALDQLGVDEEDAEFEILEEAKLGLFGRLRAEARVRARVRPTTPRPKDDRRDRRRRRSTAETAAKASGGNGDAASESAADGRDAPSTGGAGAGAGGAGAGVAGGGGAGGGGAGGGGAKDGGSALRRTATAVSGTSSGPDAATPSQGRSRRGRRGRGDRPSGAEQRARPDQDGDRQSAGVSEMATDEGAGMDVSLDEQGAVARDFLQGLVREMNLQADIDVVRPDDDTVEVNLHGSDLGLLIGPKGTTLFALQDLTRTVVQHKTSASNGRLLVDVSEYRQKRKAALERFAKQLADEVNASGTRKILEPMNASDRKVVHDAINEIDGVATTSEGEDPHRRVVIFPSGA